MNEQPNTPEQALAGIAEQNKKMRKRLLITIGIVLGLIALLMGTIFILKACREPEEFSLPDTYFHPTYKGDIFGYYDYMQKRPDVILYCDDPDGIGRTTSVEEHRKDEFAPEVFYLRDFLQIMMHADIDAYNNCFNEIYYKDHDQQEPFSQQMIYAAEIRLVSQEDGKNGEKISTYYLLYKLYENDGSLRRDVGSDAIVPMRIVLRTMPTGEISISEWMSTRTK